MVETSTGMTKGMMIGMTGITTTDELKVEKENEVPQGQETDQEVRKELKAWSEKIYFTSWLVNSQGHQETVKEILAGTGMVKIKAIVGKEVKAEIMTDIETENGKETEIGPIAEIVIMTKDLQVKTEKTKLISA